MNMVFGLLLSIVALLSLSACGDADTHADRYPLGSAAEDLNYSKEKIVFEHIYDAGSGAPMIIALHGYTLPTRPLHKGERILVIEESPDTVSYLYFCKDGKLCFYQLSGS